MKTNTPTLPKGTQMGNGLSDFGEKIIRNTSSYLTYCNDALKIAKNAKKELYLLDFCSDAFFWDNSFIETILSKPREGCKIFIASYDNNIESIRRPFEKAKRNIATNNKEEGIICNVPVSKLIKDSKLIKRVNLYTSNVKIEPEFLASENSILIKGKQRENGSQNIYIQSSDYHPHPILGFSNVLDLAGCYGRRLGKKYKEYFIKLINHNKLEKINILK